MTTTTTTPAAETATTQEAPEANMFDWMQLDPAINVRVLNGTLQRLVAANITLDVALKDAYFDVTGNADHTKSDAYRLIQDQMLRMEYRSDLGGQRSRVRNQAIVQATLRHFTKTAMAELTRVQRSRARAAAVRTVVPLATRNVYRVIRKREISL